MITFLSGLFLGFYSGGAVVTSITVRTIDGEEVGWKESLFVVLFWWYVLIDASRNEE